MKNACVFWFTGLSGSGKTTIAQKLNKSLKKEGYSVLILDGDTVREKLHKHLNFTKEDIIENNRLIVELCRRHQKEFDVILVPIISPFKICRNYAKKLLGNDKFYEIFFSADIASLEKRDVKGLYSKAWKEKEFKLIGYLNGAAYEAPDKPDFTIDSSRETVEDSLKRFYIYVNNILHPSLKN